jgi:hypothetical protein
MPQLPPEPRPIPPKEDGEESWALFGVEHLQTRRERAIFVLAVAVVVAFFTVFVWMSAFGHGGLATTILLCWLALAVVWWVLAGKKGDH